MGGSVRTEAQRSRQAKRNSCTGWGGDTIGYAVCLLGVHQLKPKVELQCIFCEAVWIDRKCKFQMVHEPEYDCKGFPVKGIPFIQLLQCIKSRRVGQMTLCRQTNV